MARISVPEADAILDHPFPVLDKGFVRLVDYMGGDARVVQAARVSYGEGTKTVREDAGLINYLMKNGHTSPFEQVVLTFHMKLPIFVARQVIRHRTARLNEISGRYSVLKDEFYVPAPERVQAQSAVNKQGSGAALAPEVAQQVRQTLEADQAGLYSHYEEFLAQDVARELARVNLPLSLYTEWYWQVDLHNMLHFLRLRLDWHAQVEVRAYAEAMAAIARRVAPLCYEAFEEHVLEGRRFSRKELAALRAMLHGQPVELAERARAELEGKLWGVAGAPLAPGGQG
ncbi:MAG: FAD-dependent thymidylate synthase [Candidatus Sericytochromatia bacterium]|nr:FAD-dependent thymidylate synthase [Candidatus Sericytochromatia bacterium]